jgi:hypothetical protein
MSATTIAERKKREEVCGGFCDRVFQRALEKGRQTGWGVGINDLLGRASARVSKALLHLTRLGEWFAPSKVDKRQPEDKGRAQDGPRPCPNIEKSEVDRGVRAHGNT